MSAEKQDAAPAAATPQVKSNTVLLLVIAVLGTLLVAGAVGAVLMSRGGNRVAQAAADDAEHAAGDEGEDAAAKKPEKAKAGKGKDSKAKDKKGAPKDPAIYIPLEPPFVVNFPLGQGARFLQTTVEVMTRDAATAQVLKDNNPLLRNDLLLLLSAQAQGSLVTPEGREELRKRALDTVRGVVKAEGTTPENVEAVYFTSFIMQ